MAPDLTKPPVVVDVRELSAADIDSLAIKLIEEQRKNVGAEYAYCGTCGAGVSRSSAHRAQAAKSLPRCRACHRKWRKKGHADTTIYLCAVCRKPITDGRMVHHARSRSRHGAPVTCGSGDCVRALRCESGRAAYARMTKQSQAKCAEAMHSRTPAQRRECSRKAHAAMTASQRRERARRAGRQSAKTRPLRTHCSRGHEYTPKNTYRNAGKRRCRECMRERDIRRRENARRGKR